MLNIFYAFILMMATILLRLIMVENIQIAIVLLVYLSSLFILAMESRSLNYIHFHPKQIKRQTIITINFILKIVGIILFFLYFFNQNNWLFSGLIIISLIEVGLFFLVRKWLYSDITFKDIPKDKTEINLRRDVIVSCFSYLITVCLVFFPNYRNLIHWLFILPLIITVTVWMKLMKKILMKNNGANKYLTYNFLFFLSLIGFVLTKYGLGVETPISIPVLVDLIIMYPCFSRLAKIVRNKGQS